MRTILLLLALMAFAPQPTSAGEPHDHDHASEVKCNCPKDCPCHAPGGTCPGDTCTKDCKCNTFHGYYKPFIHPAVIEQIQKEEGITVSDTGLRGDGILNADNVNRDRPTGFHPTMEFYRGAKYINIKADPELLRQYAEKGLNYRDFSYSPVRGQPQGSCWAEGAVSAFELNWNAVIPGGKSVFAVNDVIDCSGYGTARGGGQLSLEYALNGLAYESEYPYTGRDGRCKKDIERHNPLKEVAILRGENGGFPTEPELLTAFFKYGAMEVCGSAGALGSGGRQDEPRGGSTNHCYAYGSAIPGKSRGWLDAWYHGMKNSWGDGESSPLNISRGKWGEKGWGDYRLSKDGRKLLGSVITEIMVGFAGPRVPPVPVHFFIEGEHVDLKITIDPIAGVSQADLTARIESVLSDLEG